MPNLIDKMVLLKYTKSSDSYEEARGVVAERGAEIMRELRGSMSTREYAEILGVGLAYVSQVENGHTILSPKIARRMIERAK